MSLPFSRRCKLRVLSIIQKSIHYFTPIYISGLIKKVQYYNLFVTKILFSLSPGILIPYILEILKISVPLYGITSLLPSVLLYLTKDVYILILPFSLPLITKSSNLLFLYSFFFISRFILNVLLLLYNCYRID